MLKIKNEDLFCRHCFIQDEWVAADSGQTVDVTNPATGQVLGTVPFCGAEEVLRKANDTEFRLDDYLEIKRMCMAGI